MSLCHRKLMDTLFNMALGLAPTALQNRLAVSYLCLII